MATGDGTTYCIGNTPGYLVTSVESGCTYVTAWVPPHAWLRDTLGIAVVALEQRHNMLRAVFLIDCEGPGRDTSKAQFAQALQSTI